LTTFGGKVEFSVLPIKPETPLSVLWLIDTFDSAALDRARADIAALFKQMHGRPLRLLVLRGKDMEAYGPFVSISRLNRTISDFQLEEGAPSAATGTNPLAESPSIVDLIDQNIAQLGSGWSPVLLIGTLPKADEAVSAYAQALLLRNFTNQQLRVFLLPMAGDGDSWTPTLQSTGGGVIHDVDELNPLLQEVGQSFLQVTWTRTPSPTGFVVFPAVVADAQQNPIVTVMDLADSGAPLPSVEQYASQQKELEQISEGLQNPGSAESVIGLRARLISAEQINPADPLLLRLEVTYCEQGNAFGEAVKAARLLALVRPSSGSSFAILGHAQLLASAYDESESSLNRAAELKVPPEQLAEDYVHVHLGRKDEPGALPYLDLALRTDGKRQDLWFLQALTAEHVRDPALAIHSYEQGLSLGGLHVAESGALLRLYLATNDPVKAHAFARQTIDAMPPSGTPRAEFAQIVEDAKLPAEALAGWKSVLAVQPEMETAHVHGARLLLQSGDVKAAEDAAANGLQILPKSADLYLIQAEAILQQGRAYDARSALEEGASAIAAPTVLSRLATMQDSYGAGAAEAYGKLAEVLEKGSPQRLEALQRGLRVALRDDELSEAASFTALLQSEGHSEYLAFLAKNEKSDDKDFVPGGRDALAFMAEAKKAVPADKFFAEFARALVVNLCTRVCSGNEYPESLQKYFENVSELEQLGTRDGHRTLISLSLNGPSERKHTERVLNLLGIELRSEKGDVKLVRGGSQKETKKQEAVSALRVDEVGIQEALQAGKPATIEISDEPATIYPNAKLWHDSFPTIGHSEFALSLLHSPHLARLYVSLSALDRRTLQALLSVTSLAELSEHFADSFARYGKSLAVQGTHAAVPGGITAEPVWTQLIAASPANAGSFFHALLNQPNMFAYFYALSELDVRHQAFFTANLDRTRSFYLLFTNLSGLQGEHRDLTISSSFSELMRSVPLDSQGHIAFPGSPEIWEVAAGNNSDNKNVAKLMEKASRTASPEVEDSVLLRLAEIRFKVEDGKDSELANFLAVARLNAHRIQPLDEESALLLAQHYSDSWPAFAYFTDLPDINGAGFHSFFDLIDRVRQHSVLERNLEMGQLHSMLAWLSILDQRHVISGVEAARLFSEICNTLGTTADEGKRSAASLRLAGEILADCTHGHVAPWDETLRGCLLGPSAASDNPRGQDYQRVLDAQKVPSLDTLHSIDDAVASIQRNSSTAWDSRAFASSASSIAKAAATLTAVSIPKNERVSGLEREAILCFDPVEVKKLASELSQIAARQKANPKAAQKTAEELLKALEPQITAALAGPVYAYYLRSADLVVSEDPLLLRKHRFFDFGSSTDRRVLLQEAYFVPSSEGVGSYFQGGFAQFGLAAGRAAAAGWRQGGTGADAMMSAQIAAIRAAAWDHLIESDQRLLSLRILAAREWIVQSASEPEYFQALSEKTMGLLSLSRRADLLNGIEDRDWQTVWESITLPDLFLLGKEYPGIDSKHRDPSPVVAELRELAASNDGSRLDILARIPYQVLGCSHPHIANDAPYEEYERRLIPEDLAERTADFKLFLAYRANNLGLEPADIGRVAEKLAGRAFRASQLADYHDWRSLFAAYASLTDNDIKQALEQ
jgi:hypothetical protein